MPRGITAGGNGVSRALAGPPNMIKPPPPSSARSAPPSLGTSPLPRSSPVATTPFADERIWRWRSLAARSQFTCAKPNHQTTKNPSP